MDSNSAHRRRINRLVWGGLVGVIGLILAAFAWKVTRTSDTSMPQDLIALGPLPAFLLTNQHGQAVSLPSLQGTVWIADIIFTRCPGPCAVMTRRMAQLQAALPPEWPVRLVSLTTDPDYDTPEILQTYAHHYGARSNRWHFLTGPKADVRRLAVDGLKLAAVEVPPADRTSPDDLFIHSTLLVVVDQQGRLRFTFESLPRTGDEAEGEGSAKDADVAFQKIKENLLQAVRRLVQEKP